MSVILMSLLAVTAQAAPAAPGPAKGFHYERRSDCLGPGAFEQLMSVGGDGWGIEEGEAQRSVDLLGAAVQCRAFASGAEKACDALGIIPHFAAGKLLAANCRSEHHLLVFHAAMKARDGERAEVACERWYDLNRGFFSKGLKSAALCRRAVELLSENKSTACDRLGTDVAALVGDAREQRDVTGLCRALWTPGRASCGQPGLPMERKACEAYGQITAALRSGDAKDCPKGDRYAGLCRAMLAKLPVPACELVRAEWQKLICAKRFAAGQGGDE